MNVLQSLGPDFAIQVDEDETFTVEEFFQMKFSRTKGHQDTVKKITEFNKKCCRPVQEKITTPELRPSNAGTDLIQPSYNRVVIWLKSCFFACIPTQRGSSHWATSNPPSTPDLQPNSSCPSTEAIIVDTRD